eukprot:3810570-Rhodomonas_salina.2
MFVNVKGFSVRPQATSNPTEHGTTCMDTQPERYIPLSQPASLNSLSVSRPQPSSAAASRLRVDPRVRAGCKPESQPCGMECVCRLRRPLCGLRTGNGSPLLPRVTGPVVLSSNSPPTHSL